VKPKSRNRWLFPAAVILAALGLAAAAIADLAAPGDSEAHALRVPPPGRVLYGVQLDWHHETPSDYASRLGRHPSLYGEYVRFPFTPDIKARITGHVEEVAQLDGGLLLTLMPEDGLESVTPAAIRDLVETASGWTKHVPLLIRFGHEMNGSWYAWGQKPNRYVNTFRRIANAIHARVPGAAMVWAPNDGSGYPFPNGPYSVHPGTAALHRLDTDHDRRLTLADDPYAPYYPGSRYVDWVGLTLYHFGYRWPWNRNEVPEPGAFAAKLTGTYSGNGGDQRAVPNFYRLYAADTGKPMLITETSALHVPSKPGASNLRIKRTWWRQLFDPRLPERFPMLKGVLWFEYDKFEYGAERDVQWAATYRPSLRRAFRRTLPSWLVFAR
jgi:hypothetical protein